MSAAQTMPGRLNIPDGQLSYEVAGAGPAVLLIHADVADHRMWDDQFAALASRFRVIRYDKRGFGQTTSTSGRYSYRDDIAALLDHLGVERVAVVGLSNGANLAVDFTLDHPERITALVAVAGGLSAFAFPPTEGEMLLFGEYTALLKRRDHPALVELGLRVWCDGPGQPEGRAPASVRERVRTMLADMYRQHTEDVQPTLLEPPASERLGAIQVPTLAVVGDIDFTSTIAAVGALARGVPGARLVVFPGVAHMVNMEKPEAFTALVTDFLD